TTVSELPNGVTSLASRARQLGYQVATGTILVTDPPSHCRPSMQSCALSVRVRAHVPRESLCENFSQTYLSLTLQERYPMTVLHHAKKNVSGERGTG
ncbi:MAG: hypothetical protein ACXVCM_26305, partial [Ktedonobacteraceae bacterium]